MINNNQINNRPSLIQTIGAVLTAGVMWGSANVIIRSLLIEGLNEIFLVTARVSIIGTLLFFYYVIFNKEKFNRSNMSVHATIIEALIQNKTIYQLPMSVSYVLSILLAMILSFFISRLKPTHGLFIILFSLLVRLISLVQLLFHFFRFS